MGALRGGSVGGGEGAVRQRRRGDRLDDGTEKEYGPGDAYVIPPGHDAWVVGDEPVVTVDMSRATAEHYAKEE